MPQPAVTDDAALVAQAAGGSEYAFRALYRAYVRPVYWLAHRLVGTATDAEDVTQETFLVAWRKLPGLELAGDSLLPWLVTVCRFQAANRIRTLTRDRENTAGAADDAIASPVNIEQQIVDREFAERILREVDSLGLLDREIFRLCATEGYAYQAAAEQLGVEHGVVRNRLSRIRTRLRTVAKEST
ncbi:MULTISPECIES: sigma-70 family RNA polymerase sigma factor [unclassified Microbacterium]|uniref:RNA polymerase sigma factor n=1 Tax=unclassified Microbacterium TaxID=2609290 RepID=UPI00214B85DE|nr:MULTISPECIES: sigma-70 family RNA polymerase sigma factor [unclassified Microbacterium]MCR2809357.1 sigma-70 family RNA polymerase sigma factor [Microbacterium sp. zg.B185]WIM20496.1 sigma-70 family RNA polymerase sigma factor [Microbacterium sp. zg-B185]